MAIKLYSWPRSSGTRVAWALEELGVAYEYVELDAKKLEHRAATIPCDQSAREGAGAG